MSLLESCTALAIISSCVIFAAPSLLRAREDYQLNVVARQVAGRMLRARIIAISRNRDCRIRVTSATSYAIECQDPGWQAHETIQLPTGFSISASASPQFHMRGNVAPAATLTVRGARSKTRRVVVNITGRVRVE
jgi:Tfp pilus assembly protein FimT